MSLNNPRVFILLLFFLFTVNFALSFQAGTSIINFMILVPVSGVSQCVTSLTVTDHESYIISRHLKQKMREYSPDANPHPAQCQLLNPNPNEKNIDNPTNTPIIAKIIRIISTLLGSILTAMIRRS